MQCLLRESYLYASGFFLTAARFGFEAPSSEVTAVVAFLDAVLLSFAFNTLFFLELPYESLQIFPFFDFLSPFPMA